MKKERLYAKFLKETFFTSEENFSARKVKRLTERVQKGKKVEPPLETQAALHAFLNREGLEPVCKEESPAGLKSRRLRWIGEAVGSVVVVVFIVGGLWSQARVYDKKQENETTETEGTYDEAMGPVKAEDDNLGSNSRGQGNTAEEKPEYGGEAALECLKAMSQDEIEEQLLGQSREEIIQWLGEPEKVEDGGEGMFYLLPDSHKILWLTYSTMDNEETVSGVVIADILE